MNQILLIEELRRNHQLMGLSSEIQLTEAPVVQPQWVRNIVSWVEEGRALGKSWGANTTELGKALRSLKNANGDDILPAIARISRLSSELGNEIGLRVYSALKTRKSYKSIFDATKSQGVSNLNAGMDESRMIQQVDALLEAGITNPEVRGMVRGPLIDEIKATHAQSSGRVSPNQGGQSTTPPVTGQGRTTPVTPSPSVTNAIVGGDDDEIAREFIRELKKRGLKVSAKNIEEIKAAIKEFNTLIKGFTNRFANSSYASWDEFAGEGVDIKKIAQTWETLPVRQQQEIIRKINKNMEEAFGKWIAGFRLSENSQNLAVQFFHNFFYKKVIMLGKTPKGFGDWVSWYYYSVLYSFAAMTIAEVIACAKNGLTKSCLNIFTDMWQRLSLSVIPFFNMAWGGANVLYQTIVSIVKGLSPYVGAGSTREEGFFSTDLSGGEAQSFVENDNGLSGLLPPGLDMSKIKFIYKEVEGKNNQVDVYMMETGQKEEDASKIATLEKVLSPGKQAGDFQAYRIKIK